MQREHAVLGHQLALSRPGHGHRGVQPLLQRDPGEVGRSPDHQARGHRDAAPDRLTARRGHQRLGCGRALCLQPLVHRGQAGPHHRRDPLVVEPGEQDVLGHPEPLRGQRPQDAERGQVVQGDDRLDVPAPPQQVEHPLVARVVPEVPVDDQVLVDGDVPSSHLLPEHLLAGERVRLVRDSPHQRHPGHPAVVEQVPHELAHAGDVVGPDARPPARLPTYPDEGDTEPRSQPDELGLVLGDLAAGPDHAERTTAAQDLGQHRRETVDEGVVDADDHTDPVLGEHGTDPVDECVWYSSSAGDEDGERSRGSGHEPAHLVTPGDLLSLAEERPGLPRDGRHPGPAP